MTGHAETPHGQCRLCGSDRAVIVGTRDRHMKPLINVVCEVCGLVRVDPLPEPEQAEEYYRDDYRVEYHGAETPSDKVVAKAKVSAQNRLVLVRERLQPGARVLDFGASSGEFVHALKEAGYEAEGMEPNIGYASAGIDRYGITIRITGWREGLYPDGQFDAVTTHHVFEHLTDPLAAMRAVRAWLKPGGLFFFVVPDLLDANRPALGRWHYGHLHGFNQKTLEMMALRAGFELVASTRPCECVFRRVETPAEDWMTYPRHGSRMREFFLDNTVPRQFLKPHTYLYALGKLGRHVRRLFR
ncbi:MAG: class I SAM-dependent methyltransferase [Hyphomicrobiaceae bacterium]|nr:class I SAM-dependent methyltransferase [Hyphomicrobiaceae bacterium]